MLILNRRVGQTMYIGHDVCVTVFGKFDDHTTIGVLAPPAAVVRFGDAVVTPTMLDSGERFYLLTLLSGKGFAIDATEVRVKFGSARLSTFGARSKHVQFAIQAPAHLAVHREEIYTQIQAAAGLHTPAVSFAKRLQRANASVSGRHWATLPWASAGACAPANAEFIFT
jgi:sRNA-binding carbon storage regulator CsrA